MSKDNEKYVCEAWNFRNECDNVVHSARANYFSVTKAKYCLEHYESVVNLLLALTLHSEVFVLFLGWVIPGICEWSVWKLSFVWLQINKILCGRVIVQFKNFLLDIRIEWLND